MAPIHERSLSMVIWQRYLDRCDKWQLKTQRESVMTNAGAMDKDKDTAVRRPDVLKKFTKENLNILERGLLGELPTKLQPHKLVRSEPVKSSRSDLVVVQKQPAFIASCLGPLHDSSDVEISPEEDNLSPLKKSFSFRETLSRLNFFGKDKEKTDKYKTKNIEKRRTSVTSATSDTSTMERENKSKKRFWNFRSKELSENKVRHRPIFSRSKSYEFLPKSAIEQEEKFPDLKEFTKNSQSFIIVSSTDSLGADLNTISNDERAFLRSVKECPNLELSRPNSIDSTGTSNSGGLVMNLLKSESMEDVLKEFDRTMDLFTESYLSDCEPYTKRYNDLSVKEKRRSNSFRIPPSPKILQVNKVSEVSEDFKRELACRLTVKPPVPRMERRTSVTDWYVLEDQKAYVSAATEAKSRRRLVKKPVNRVRRMSSTKYAVQEMKTLQKDMKITKASEYRMLKKKIHTGPEDE